MKTTSFICWNQLLNVVLKKIRYLAKPLYFLLPKYYINTVHFIGPVSFNKYYCRTTLASEIFALFIFLKYFSCKISCKVLISLYYNDKKISIRKLWLSFVRINRSLSSNQAQLRQFSISKRLLSGDARPFQLLFYCHIHHLSIFWLRVL